MTLKETVFSIIGTALIGLILGAVVSGYLIYEWIIKENIKGVIKCLTKKKETI